MEKQQITRIPLKYFPILETLGYENVGKIFINILGGKIPLNTPEKIYFDLIMTDVNAINKKAGDGNKGGRPQNKPKVIENIEPMVILPLKPSIDKTSIDKNKLDNINIPFTTFRDLYDKKIGDKNKCEKKWLKLKDEERKKIIETLPIRKQQFSDKQFQPYPETYLNQNRRNDIIEQSKRKDFILLT